DHRSAIPRSSVSIFRSPANIGHSGDFAIIRPARPAEQEEGRDRTTTTSRAARRQRPVIAPPRNVVALVQPAFVAQMDMRELTIRTGQIKCNRTARLGRAATDLGEAEFKTLRKIDPDAMFGAGHGIADRLTYRPHEARDFQLGFARVDINIKVNRMKQRL